MSSQSDLFLLIKSMSKSEKRYFTLDAKKSGEKTSKYLQLFTLINGMDVYNEDKIKKKFPKNLSADKIYLYESILRSMRDYHSTNSMVAKMKEMILDSKYLYERGLYELCKKRLSGAKYIATEMHDQATLLEINKEERRLLRVGNIQKYQVGVELLLEEQDKVSKLLIEELEYLNLYDKLLSYVKAQHNMSDDEHVKQLKNEVGSLLSIDVEKLSARGQHRFYQCNVLYYQLLRKFDKQYNASLKVMYWWDAYPKYKQELFYIYIMDLSNLIQGCLTEGRYDYVLPLIEKLDNEKPRTALDKGILFQSSTNSKLLYFFQQLDFEGAKKLIPSIEEGLQKHQISSNSRIAITYNIIALFFILEEYDTCIEWIERITKNIKTDLRQDIQRASRLILMVCKFELGIPEKYDSSYRSVYRYFKNKQNLSSLDFSMMVIKFINTINASPDNEKTIKYKDLHSYLVNLKESPIEKKPVGLNELIYWVKSKIEKKSILKLIKELSRSNVSHH